MGKRGAEDQLTKDDAESSSRGRGSDDDEVEEVRKDASQEALAGRRIRGLPKRKAPVGPTTSTKSATSSAFGSGSTGTTPTAPTFSFGAPTSTSSLSTPSFSFGNNNTNTTSTPSAFAALASVPSQPKPSSLFSFGAPTSSTPTASPFAAASAPAAPVQASSQDSTAGPAKSPFAAFSFGEPAAPAPAVPAPATMNQQEDTNTKASPFSGFSFGGVSDKPAAPAQAMTNAPASSPFALFGNAASTPAPAASTSKPPVLAAPVSSTPVATSNPVDAPKVDVEEKYLVSIRGLNMSVIRALEVAVKQDPFLDLGEALGRMKIEYEGHLRGIKKEAGKPGDVEAPSEQAQVNKSGMDVDTNGPVEKVAVTSVEKAAPIATSATVAPPKAGAFTLPAPTASTSVATGGFKPAAPITGFSFGGKTIDVGSKPAEQSAPAASPFVFKPAGDQAATVPQPQKPTTAAAALVQGMLDETPVEGSTEQTEKVPSTPASKSAFTLGSTTPASAPPSSSKRSSALFAIKPDVRKSTAGDSPSMIIPPPSSGSVPVPFVFKASNAGFNIGSGGSSAVPASTSAASGSSAFPFSPAASKQGSAGFSFGKADASAANGEKASTSSATSQPAFSFGTPAGSGFSFGKPADASTGVTSKPAPSFSFGSMAQKVSNASAPKPPVFSFGGPAAASGSSTTVAAAPESTEPSENSAPAALSSDLTTGEGEEDEETLWEHKAQIGMLVDNGEGKKSWSDWRVCKVKLKRENRKEGQQESQPMRRLLMRVDPSGQVYQNFSLRSLATVLPLGPSGLVLGVGAADGKLSQIGMRFKKKTDSFDPQPHLQQFKAAINAERRAMKLAEI